MKQETQSDSNIEFRSFLHLFTQGRARNRKEVYKLRGAVKSALSSYRKDAFPNGTPEQGYEYIFEQIRILTGKKKRTGRKSLVSIYGPYENLMQNWESDRGDYELAVATYFFFCKREQERNYAELISDRIFSGELTFRDLLKGKQIPNHFFKEKFTKKNDQSSEEKTTKKIEAIKEKGRNFVENEVSKFINTGDHRGIGTLSIIDIDDMTKINKVFNWRIGNNVLDIVEVILSDSLRKFTHTIGRCGDDTFYAVIAGEGVQSTYSIMGSLIENIKSYDWNFEAHGLRVSASVGFANHRLLESSIEMAVRAGLGLETSKRGGGSLVSIGPEYLSERDKLAYGSTYAIWS